MKKITFLAIANLLAVAPISNYILNGNLSNENQNTLKKNIAKTKKNQDFVWETADLNDFNFPTDTRRNSNEWETQDLTNHDLNINYIDFKNGTGRTMQHNVYRAVSKAFDHRYINFELGNFKKFNILSNLTDDYFVYKTSLFITILSKSSNSLSPLNDNNASFKNFSINYNEIQSFYLRISNHQSMDWNSNTSFFDVSLNICNFDTYSSSVLADKSENLNVNCLPTTSGDSSKYFETTHFGMQKATSHVDNIEQNWSSHTTYGLSKINSSILNFSGSVLDNMSVEGMPIWEKVKWTGDGFYSPNQPGTLSANQFCQNFNSYSDIYKYVKSISITSDCSLEDWCTPNSNSHQQIANHETVTWNNNQTGLPTYNEATSDDTNLPWNHKPDSNVTASWQYIPNTQYDHQFGWSIFGHHAGHMYLAAFMVFCESPINNSDIDVFTMFTSQLDNTVLAGIDLKFAVHSTKITFNFDDTVFENEALPYEINKIW